MSAPWPAILVSSPEEVRRTVELAYGLGRRVGSCNLTGAIRYCLDALSTHHGSMLIYFETGTSRHFSHARPSYPPNQGLTRLNSLAHLTDYLKRHHA